MPLPAGTWWHIVGMTLVLLRTLNDEHGLDPSEARVGRCSRFISESYSATSPEKRWKRARTNKFDSVYVIYDLSPTVDLIPMTGSALVKRVALSALGGVQCGFGAARLSGQ